MPSAPDALDHARPTVVLDCDPGLDDAVAIALAVDLTDLVGITTVGGNVGIEATTTNALTITDLLGRPDVEVHAGHDEPFAADGVQRAAGVHGRGGLGDTELPPPSRPPTSDDAVTFILEASRRHDDLWVVATGPLTNVAHAVTLDPTLVERVAGVSWMGGSRTYGNVTAVAEFNAWADPEAIAVVVDAGFRRVLMHGLDVTHTVLLDVDWIDRLADESGEVPRVFAELLSFYLDRQRTVSALGGAAVHDALAVLHPARPDLFEIEPHHLQAVLDSVARGMTIVDQRPLSEPANAPNIEAVVAADAEAIRELIWHTLTRTR